MKSTAIISVIVLWVGGVAAAPPQPEVSTGQPAKPDLEEVTVETPVQLEKAVPPDEAWTQAEAGVIGQFFQAPNLLAPINPLAQPEAGWGDRNLSRDTVTGRVMGLRLVKVEF